MSIVANRVTVMPLQPAQLVFANLSQGQLFRFPASGDDHIYMKAYHCGIPCAIGLWNGSAYTEVQQSKLVEPIKAVTIESV